MYLSSCVHPVCPFLAISESMWSFPVCAHLTDINTIYQHVVLPINAAAQNPSAYSRRSSSSNMSYLFLPHLFPGFEFKFACKVQCIPECTVCVAFVYRYALLLVHHIKSHKMSIDRRSRMLFFPSFVTYISIPHHPVFFLQPSCS